MIWKVETGTVINSSKSVPQVPPLINFELLVSVVNKNIYITNYVFPTQSY
jgi:hypothetical protein